MQMLPPVFGVKVHTFQDNPTPKPEKANRTPTPSY